MNHFQFFFDTFYESAKLGALRAFVPYVSSALRALVPYVPRVIRAIVPYVLSCPTCLVPYVLSCHKCPVSYVVSCPTYLVPYMLWCPTYSRDPRASYLIWPRVSRFTSPFSLSNLLSCTLLTICPNITFCTFLVLELLHRGPIYLKLSMPIRKIETKWALHCLNLVCWTLEIAYF